MSTAVLRGALAGAVATGAMTLAMTVLNGAPPWARRKSLPPRQITMRLAAKADTHPEHWTEAARRGATAVSHMAYGVGAGAGYGAMAHRLPGDTITRGAAFGLALWGVSYAGWLPAPGAVTLTAPDLLSLRPFSLHDAFAFVPGVFAVDDDVLGRRSGIGVRGAPARRSRKTLLLEDGTPITRQPTSTRAFTTRRPSNAWSVWTC